jgi:hypothetical protein
MADAGEVVDGTRTLNDRPRGGRMADAGEALRRLSPRPGRPDQSNERSEVRLAGWTGLEPGADTFSNLVMARDFWFKRLSHKRLHRSVSFTAVHPNSRDSTGVVETYWRQVLARPTPSGDHKGSGTDLSRASRRPPRRF